MSASQYWTVLDLYPDQYEDSTRLYQFYTALRERGRLTTTRCRACGEVHWPPRLICPRCLADDLEWVDMPERGRIYSYTVAWAGLPPELAGRAPVVYALVDFPNGIRVLSVLVDARPEDVRTGLAVELAVGTVPPDFQGRERVIPYFRLTKEGDGEMNDHLRQAGGGID